ncbi:Bro-N domain-containing protein [uncultured Desulfovibrio sp.]|uniref:BRO-N domain-containing protein n=1 Tax=uncultured Desulfovibrio sp. TaxID=167968 RepID=UPI00320B57AC
MAENTISQSAPIVNENGMHYVEFEGQIYFSSDEIGRQLGYAKPSKSINILFSRNQKELRGYAVGIKMMSTDGKFYEVRCFTEEGVYILSMLANTPRAQEFRAKLARLLREIRERRMTLAREAGYRQGREEGQMARQEAARLVWQLGPAQKRRLRAAVRYRGLGLGREALARLLRCHSREVSRLLKAARALGWLEDAPTPPAPVRASLLEEVRHAR